MINHIFFNFTGFNFENNRCFGVIKSLHFEIAYALQGSLANPQNKIVGAVLKAGQTHDLIVSSVAGNINVNATQYVDLVTIVSFIDVTKPSSPSYSQPPSVDIKLPYDFFYPFLPSSSRALWCDLTVFVPCLIFSFIVCNTHKYK